MVNCVLINRWHQIRHAIVRRVMTTRWRNICGQIIRTLWEQNKLPLSRHQGDVHPPGPCRNGDSEDDSGDSGNDCNPPRNPVAFDLEPVSCHATPARTFFEANLSLAPFSAAFVACSITSSPMPDC
jgi:hypothetical protein